MKVTLGVTDDAAVAAVRAELELTVKRLEVENAQLLSEHLAEENARLLRENALLRLGLTSPMTPGPPPGLCSPALLKADPVESSFVSTVCPSEADSERGFELTTMMMRNVPKTFNRQKLLVLLHSEGFAGTYDFVYLPVDHITEAALGYAFVNFTSQAMAERFRDHFQGFRRWGVRTEKVCEVVWGNGHQGLEAHVDRYRNSPVMHASVRDEFKPAVFVNGQRVPFPAPTRRIKGERRNGTANNNHH